MFYNFLLPISRQALHTTWPQLRILGNLDGIFPWPYLVGDNFGKLNRNFRVHCAQWSALLRLERWSTIQKKSCRNINCQVLNFDVIMYHVVNLKTKKNHRTNLPFWAWFWTIVVHQIENERIHRECHYLPLRLNDDAIFCFLFRHYFVFTFVKNS